MLTRTRRASFQCPPRPHVVSNQLPTTSVLMTTIHHGPMCQRPRPSFFNASVWMGGSSSSRSRPHLDTPPLPPPPAKPSHHHGLLLRCRFELSQGQGQGPRRPCPRTPLVDVFLPTSEANQRTSAPGAVALGAPHHPPLSRHHAVTLPRD